MANLSQNGFGFDLCSVYLTSLFIENVPLIMLDRYYSMSKNIRPLNLRLEAALEALLLVELHRAYLKVEE
ncbi:hypothetical protein A3196_03145 [Candidatus Thiodiazotropha endoloripes]|uniref:Uncharacterized protein n=1 Tax=Candidatus Thiodiazotropha endoloripes TaxID=1818881 RepID=A0A1E2UMA3_9GAMM|nr:hypothetical protein A3196_03145 [Candidatus Thiodiazotropha endoloripes]